VLQSLVRGEFEMAFLVILALFLLLGGHFIDRKYHIQREIPHPALDRQTAATEIVVPDPAAILDDGSDFWVSQLKRRPSA
jgi:hypothetical protein